MITSAIQQSIAEIPFFIAASNLTDVYFVFSHNFSAKAADGTENVAFLKGQAAPGAADANRAQVHFRRQFKDCSFHPYPHYMLKHGLGATASHVRLADNLFQWRVSVGSKLIPEDYVITEKRVINGPKNQLRNF